MPSVTLPSHAAPGIFGGNDVARPRAGKILCSDNSEDFTYNDLAPVIGREFEGVQVAELLKPMTMSSKIWLLPSLSGESFSLPNQNVTPNQMKDHSVYVNKGFTERISGVTKDESDVEEE
ncbi:hypothetical protein B0T17DRAFT_620506 [Bombardia bombarda]|uniref:Uncharacterized protein n=1 Tax=Bombardia bombarda TaxID=252184 RepID=A0AA39U6Y1_9PEZI|nr:hypothetical protein B0T17DRAFT_620506 [Bombardia bombarda]